jgi:membrane protease YdiL (CAAX protease family)
MCAGTRGRALSYQAAGDEGERRRSRNVGHMRVSPAEPRSRVASVAGLIVAIGLPFLIQFLPGQAHQDITDARQDTVVLVCEWIIAIVILGIVVFWEKLPLGSIGFRAPGWRDYAAMGVALVGLIVALGAFSALTHSAGTGAPDGSLLAVPLALRIALFLTAGFCEELMFRGYAIERLALFTGKLWIGGVFGVVLFTLGHLPRYGFSGSLVAVAITATALTALYLRTRNFWVCALMHALIDGVGLVVAPAFSARAPHG